MQANGSRAGTFPAMARRRIDTLMAERGLARSRTSAAHSVRAGQVRIGADGPLALRPSQLVPEEADLLVSEAPRFVSRGGVKLDNALDTLGVDIAGRDCADIGASTGGFTDCLLQRGAARVAAVDVGRGQLDWSLRGDERVTVLEGLNARHLDSQSLPFTPSLATVDVSFISLAKILPAVAGVLADSGEVVALVKPQFELARERVRRGVVREAGDRRDALRIASAAARDAGLGVLGFAGSGLPGPKGNRETFIHGALGATDLADVDEAILEVEP